MPIIGQPSHTHYTPIVTPVVLTRISLHSIYKYNVSASASRVLKTSTYLYNVIRRISAASVYIYHLNPTGLIGPTRLYLHAALSPLANLPTECLCVLTPNADVDAETVNRTMSPIIGTVQNSLVLTSTATTAQQVYYFAKFVTDTLSQVSSITAQNWTYNFAIKESSTSANFPASGTNQPVRAVSYVWRPSTQSKVGDIIDGNSNATVDEASTTLERIQTTTYSGNQVLGVQNGDVLVFEVVFVLTQAAATAFTDTFYYDGTTVNTTKNATVTNHASFIETPQGLAFGLPLTRVSKPLIQKYNVSGRVLGPRLFKYNLTSRTALARVYKYNVVQLVPNPEIYRYVLIGRATRPSLNRYNILTRKQAPKIFRYAINSRTLLSRIYRYNIANKIAPAPVSSIYKYNIANRATLPQTYQYSIAAKAALSRIYRYTISGRAARVRTLRYNIANRVTVPRIYRYPVAFKITASRVYKYTILNRLLSSKVYRYSLAVRSSLSRIYRYNVSRRVTLPGTYKYNLLSFSHVIRSSVYRYNVARRLTLSRIYGYAIATKISVPKLYRYPIAVRLTTSKVYRYTLLKAVILSRIYRYNVLIRLLSSRNYLYRLLARLSRPRLYIYNLAQRRSTPHIYRYPIAVRLSLSRSYLYRLIGRIVRQSKYIYAIGAIPSNVLWQITGKNTDFPDSLENLVAGFIKTNWSITEPVIGANPAITTGSSHQHQTQVDNFAYDNFRSYYIRVKEVASEVRNRQIRLNTYEFATPVEIEVFSRRLSKGEAFPELNNMLNELLRMFGTYQSDQIFGVVGITLDRISSMEKERPPAETLWARRLRIVLHYYRVSVVG